MTADFEFARRLRTLSDREVASLPEQFPGAARAFDATTLGDHLLYPLEMTWFYGEPVWERMDAEQRLRLNHLTFCNAYFLTMVAESAANVLNHQSAFGSLRSDPEAAFYMAREAVEESFHVEAFHTLIGKVLRHHGLSMEFLWTNGSARLSSLYYKGHTVLGWLRGDLELYYLTRYALNVGTKLIERSMLREPKLHPEVRRILKSHAVDEARHMQMSRRLGLQSVRRMGRPARHAACFAYALFVTSLNVCGRQSDRRFPVALLERCGVPRAQAERSYREWRERANQPEDPPQVRAMRRYFLTQNLAYVDELAIGPRTRAAMKRRMRRAYAEVDDAPDPASQGVRRPA